MGNSDGSFRAGGEDIWGAEDIWAAEDIWVAFLGLVVRISGVQFWGWE